jgi:xylulokinase
VGTTGVKAVLVEADGAITAQAAHEYPTRYPAPGWAEQDPEAWWASACRAIAQVLAAADQNATHRVAALCVSSQAPTLVLVDGDGRPVAPAILWLDRRSEPQCGWLRSHGWEQRIGRASGGRVDSYFLAPKLLWVAQERPTWLQGATLLLCNGYLVLRLTGERCVDRSHGPLTQLYDSATGEWHGALLDAMGINPALLPPLLECGAVAGRVTPVAAAATGLVAGTPVLAGMVDGTAAALEAGVVLPGQAVEMTGQSTVLLLCSKTPYRGRDLFALGHAAPNRHLVVGAMVATGGALRWFRDQIGAAEVAQARQTGADAFDLLTAAAADSPPGANRLLFLPWLYGERSPLWDATARGVFLGLSLATTRGDLARAVLEGAALGLRHNLAVAQEGGYTIDSLVCLGGGARSRLWTQIKADVLQRPVLVPHAPDQAGGAAVGDAILAAAAAGIHPHVDAAVAAMVRPMKRLTPNPAVAQLYDELFAVYRDVYPRLQPAFAALAALPDSNLHPLQERAHGQQSAE